MTNGDADCYLGPDERGEATVSLRIQLPDGDVRELTLASNGDLGELVRKVEAELTEAVRAYRTRPSTGRRRALAEGRRRLAPGRPVDPAARRPRATGHSSPAAEPGSTTLRARLGATRGGSPGIFG